jgi:HD-like signal output (HDOD) protein
MNSQPLERIRPKIEALNAIPSIPAIILPLTSLLQAPPDQVDIDKVVELVSYDGSIAAQCLRLANSPLFGRKNTETVRSAVMALGLKRVEAILLGCCLNRVVPADKWSFDAVTFWRHCLGCALVSRKLAKLIGYDDPEKSYLAGLIHDLGILITNIACADEFRACIQDARERHVSLYENEQQHLGFTHCDSGKILAQRWKFPADLVQVIEFHHNEAELASRPLLSLVHLSDLLCRVRNLGYGYYEAMGVHFAGSPAWESLAKTYPALAKADLARLTMDLDGAMDEIATVVDTVFATPAASH